MAKLNIVTTRQGDHRLKQRSHRVSIFDAKLHLLLDDMTETLRSVGGVGLAAPQVGVGLCVFVVDVQLDDSGATHRFELINPKTIKAKGAVVGEEGCLSLPGLVAKVQRASLLVVRAQDRHGTEFRIKVHGVLARIFQHEIDHLHGMLMTDKAIEVRQTIVLKVPHN